MRKGREGDLARYCFDNPESWAKVGLMLTAGNLFGGILFGAIGMGAFVYGKKTGGWRAMGIGVVLMVYPYFVPQTVYLYLVGALLTGGLFVFRD